MREGAAADRRPLNDPTPAGATDARVGVHLRKAATGHRAAPPPDKSRDRHEARPVEAHCRRWRPIPTAHAPEHFLAAADRQGYEAGVVTRFHPYQHAALALRACAGDDFAYFGRRRNGLAGDLQDDVAGLETIGGDAR